MFKRGINLTWFGLLRWLPLMVLLVVLLLAPQYLSDFRLNQLGKFLTYAIIAVGLDLIWGYGGMLSLGQGLFFGLGAYGFAMYLKLQSSGGKLPDFMFWSGLESLPWFWVPFQNPLFAVLAALIVPALLAGILGYFVFRSRVQGVYFSIITQALTLLTSIWFVGQQAYTGGTNGITNLGSAQLFGYSLLSSEAQHGFYFATVVCLMLVYLLTTWMTDSRFGRMLVALNTNEARAVSGLRPGTDQNAGLCDVGGDCCVGRHPLCAASRDHSPSSMGVVPSIEMVIWVAIGGRGTLFGAIISALAVSYGRSYFSETFPKFGNTSLACSSWAVWPSSKRVSLVR
ncbi:MAG: urea ABC transporter permease subunit UrtC [Caldilineaceae bacterium]